MTDIKKPYPLEKKDSYARIFTGTEYTIHNVGTVEQLRSMLEAIIHDINIDGDYEIEEVYCHDGKLGYILKNGFFTE